MYVCICKQVTDTQVNQAIATGVKTLQQLCELLPIGTQCGRCCEAATEMLEQATATHYCCQQKYPQKPSELLEQTS